MWRSIALASLAVAAAAMAGVWALRDAQGPAGKVEPTPATVSTPIDAPSAQQDKPDSAPTGDRPNAPAANAPAAKRPDEAARAAQRRPEAPRSSLLPLVQPLWSELTPTQQFVLAPFADQWNTWPLAEKRAWVELADRVPRMSAEQQARAHERIHEWAALSPEQRRLARQNYRLAQQLPKDERVAQWQQYEALTPEQKGVLRSAGTTSNTAARHAGARTALAKEAAKPIAPTP